MRSVFLWLCLSPQILFSTDYLQKINCGYRLSEISEIVVQAKRDLRERSIRASGLLISGQPTQTLRTLTLNAGLLHLRPRLLGIPLLRKPLASVPEYSTRAKFFPGWIRTLVDSKRPDIVMLQELWHYADLRAIHDELSPDFAFVKGLGSARVLNEFGLGTWIRKSILKNSSNEPLPGTLHDFRNPSGMIQRPIPEQVFSFRRGFLSAVIELKDTTKVVITNTHLSPVSSYTNPEESDYLKRSYQVKNLSRFFESHRGKVDYVLAGGDFNFSPYFSFANPAEKQLRTIFEFNKIPFAIFAGTSMLTDTWVAKNGFEEAPSWRENNPLVRSGSSAVEPDQRYDAVWFGGFEENGFRVSESEIDLDFNTQGKPKSDHDPSFSVTEIPIKK